jgi:hypothetical protein
MNRQENNPSTHPQHPFVWCSKTMRLIWNEHYIDINQCSKNREPRLE